MQSPLRLFLAMFLANGVNVPGVAQPTALADIPVNLRVDPELERQWPGVRSAIASSNSAQIAEQADYNLKADVHLQDYAELRPALTGLTGITGVSFVRLGRMSTGEAEQVLTKVLPLIQRQKALITISDRSPPNGVTFCKLNIYPPHDCVERALAQVIGPMSGSRISNAGSAARFVALFLTTADLQIRSVPLSASNKVIRLDPGQSLTVPAAGSPNQGLSHEIVVVSDRPFDHAAFEQSSPFNTRAGCYTRLYPDCLVEMAPLPSSDGMSAIRLTYAEEPPGPAMGGGVNASRGDADWMVQLYSTVPYTPEEIAADEKLPPDKKKYLKDRSAEERAHSCGGVIIARDLVLTAAHCVATGRFLAPNTARVFTDRRVRIGSLRLGKGGETRAVIGLAIHAGYSGVGTGLPNDIALLLVKPDDRIRLNPRPLDIATQPPAAGQTVTGLGWGFTKAVAQGQNLLMSMSDEVQRNPNLLQQAPLEVLAAQRCARRLPGRLKPGMLCLVTPRTVIASGGPPTFSCRGDSGGPLVRDYGMNGDELVGLTSWSLGCGDGDNPSVYTDAAHFRHWIAAARQRIKPGQVVLVGDPARVR